jgi:hypothetical protein
MLEHQVLALSPWTAVLDRAGGWQRERRVSDGLSGEALGVIRASYQRPLRWFPWWRLLRLKTFETEDAAHLLTVRRSWGWFSFWDVLDAEGERVGSYYPPSLLDRDGVRCGFVQADDPRRGTLLNLAGKPMAGYGIEPTGALRLTFEADQMTNPYLRMLIVGTVLTRQLP